MTSINVDLVDIDLFFDFEYVFLCADSEETTSV